MADVLLRVVDEDVLQLGYPMAMKRSSGWLRWWLSVRKGNGEGEGEERRARVGGEGIGRGWFYRGAGGEEATEKRRGRWRRRRTRVRGAGEEEKGERPAGPGLWWAGPRKRRREGR